MLENEFKEIEGQGKESKKGERRRGWIWKDKRGKGNEDYWEKRKGMKIEVKGRM